MLIPLLALGFVASAWVSVKGPVQPRLLVVLPLPTLALQVALALSLSRNLDWVRYASAAVVVLMTIGIVASTGLLLLAKNGAAPPFAVWLQYALAFLLALKAWSHYETRASSALPLPEPELPSSSGESEGPARLVVLVHGVGGVGGMAPMKELVRETWPDAGILKVPYLAANRALANSLSNVDPIAATRRIVAAVDAAWTSGSYDEVVLIGHSAGGLLARKALLAALGSATDVPAERSDWASKVTRVVLLAGLNRGVDFAQSRANDLPPAKRLSLWFGSWLGGLIDAATLSREIGSGRPFVANLRLDWIRAMRRSGELERAHLDVVQLLGDIDDFVADEDEADLTVMSATKGSCRFFPLRVRGTGHSDIVQLEGSDVARYRRDKLKLALTGTRSELADAAESPPVLPDDTVERVVFVVHGIRDLGEWSWSLEEEIRRRQPSWRVVSPRYGYFGMGPFLFHIARQKHVDWLVDSITEASARYPSAKFDFVGHSNGSYLLAKGLADVESLPMRNVVFAGSVVSRAFWLDAWRSPDRDAPRVGKVLNLTASSDWVVALFPSLFELPGLKRLNPNIGCAGFRGFDGGEGHGCRELHNVSILGAHGAFVGHAGAIAEFLSTGRVPRPETAESQPNPWLESCSRGGMLLVWAALVLVLLGIGAWLVTPAGAYAGFVATGYLFAVVWLLMRL